MRCAIRRGALLELDERRRIEPGESRAVGKAQERLYRRDIRVDGGRANCRAIRAAVALAKLWRDHERNFEARDLLAPIYGCFTEGYDTVDLKAAKALLVELGS